MTAVELSRTLDNLNEQIERDCALSAQMYAEGRDTTALDAQVLASIAQYDALQAEWAKS